MIKIEISKVEVLNRLLEGETEVGITIRQAVIDALLEGAIRASGNKKINAAVDNVINEEFLDWNYGGYKLKPKYRKAIRDYLFNISSALAKEILGAEDMKEKINKSIESAASRIQSNIDNLSMDDLIEAKIDAAVNKKLEAKMNKIFR